jgi:hypothetical protein
LLTHIDKEAAMTNIIAGRFEQQAMVQEAVQEILRAGFSEEQVSTFYLNPPGRHATYKAGGDHQESPGAEDSPKGVAAGATTGGVVGAAAGAATIPVLGPIGPVAGALVGAHVGSLMGSMHEMKDDGAGAEAAVEPPQRQSGMMVAVATDNAEQEARAIDVLRALHAQDIERAHGTIAHGDWEDFDPTMAPALIDQRPH